MTAPPVDAGLSAVLMIPEVYILYVTSLITPDEKVGALPSVGRANVVPSTES